MSAPSYMMPTSRPSTVIVSRTPRQRTTDGALGHHADPRPHDTRGPSAFDWKAVLARTDEVYTHAAQRLDVRERLRLPASR